MNEELKKQMRDLTKQALRSHDLKDPEAIEMICDILDTHDRLGHGYTYLASPYTDPDPEIRVKRFKAVVRKAAKLMQKGEVIFSPIAHSHHIELLGMDTVHDWEFWKRQDEPMLRRASEVKVLMLPGWDVSRGVLWEIGMAKQIGLPITYIHPEL